MEVERLEEILDGEISKLQESLLGGSLLGEGMKMAILVTSIEYIDNTLYAFRDLAGKALKNGDASIMSRYRIQKEKLLALVNKYKKITGVDLYYKLKCNS